MPFYPASSSSSGTIPSPTSSSSPSRDSSAGVSSATRPTQSIHIHKDSPSVGWLALTCLTVFLVLLIGTPIVRQAVENDWLNIFDGFYRSGSLVFGGGHVILPLLQAEVVPQGWTTKDQFIAGYGAAQAVPGPLLTFSAYLGTVNGGWTVGLFALGAIFLPSFLLVIGILPFWDNLRSRTNFRAALMGINAAVVGLVGAALYDPVWTTAITSREDLALGAAAFGLLAFWKWPPWLVVLLSAIGGALHSHCYNPNSIQARQWKVRVGAGFKPAHRFVSHR